MSEQTYQMLAIVLYFAAMLGIGYYAYRKTANLSGYMLAERPAALGRGPVDPTRPTCRAGC